MRNFTLRTVQPDFDALSFPYFPIQIPFATPMLAYAVSGKMYQKTYCMNNCRKYLEFSKNNETLRGKVSISLKYNLFK